MMHIRTVVPWMAAATCIAIGSAMIGATAARADGDPATDAVPRLIAYDGYVEFDGLPFVGDLDLRFRLYDGDSPAPVWEEIHTSWPVQAGVFAVALGRTSPIGEVVAGADALSLGIDIRLPGAAEWIQLGGRQAFAAVPFALWSAGGSDFSIGRDALVGRHLDVTGNTTLRGDVSVTGALSATSAVVAGGVSAAGGYFSSNVGTTSIEVGPGPTPFIDFTNNTPADFDARLILTSDDRLEVDGARLRARGGIDGAGYLCVQHVDCYWTGGFGYNDPRTCGSDAVQAGIKLTGVGGGNELYCCRLALRTC